MLIHEYLSTPGNSLDTLAHDYAIKVRVNIDLGVVCLNYDQIESNTSLPLVQECRSLVLELDTWEPLSWPFPRFFNLDENKTHSFDWANFETWEKLDGSLISIWNHKSQGWQVSTRSVPDGSNSYNECPETFRQLLERTLLDMGTSFSTVTSFFDPGYSYTFELQTPETQVLTIVTDRKLSLLAIRSLADLQEVHIHDWLKGHPGFPLPSAPHYPGFTLETVRATVQTRDPLAYEGYVLVDAQFNRIKVKSTAWVLMAGCRDSVGKSPRARVEIILQGKDDDIMGILPLNLQAKMVDLKQLILALSQSLEIEYERFKGIQEQKDFAMTVLKLATLPQAMFALRKGMVTSGLEFLKKSRPRDILEWVHLKDEDIQDSA